MLESFARILSDPHRVDMLFNAMLITIQISLGAVFLGLIIGSIMAAFNMSDIGFVVKGKKIRPLRLIAFVYLGVIRGTPAVTQLLIITHTVFAAVRGVSVWVGIVALGINSGAYVAEIIRAGILSVDKGQMEAGLSLGFNKAQTMIFIVMPQAIKNILPAFINEFIVLIKETAIVGFVGLQDINRVGQLIMAQTFDVTPLFITALMYLFLISVLTMLLSLFEKKLRSSDRK
ncbi:MAG: amino acid ABC transporter permease [Defluviitaleaceae bacterium]|nr:amino acid ABC transporter permease [Defluviitaleaceae bacterium]